MARNGFVTVFQPIVQLEDRRMAGLEALTRFDDERPPEVWFSEAAELRLTAPLEHATLRVAAVPAGQLPSRMHASINVRATLLQQPDDLRALPALAVRPV